LREREREREREGGGRKGGEREMSYFFNFSSHFDLEGFDFP